VREKCQGCLEKEVKEVKEVREGWNSLLELELDVELEVEMSWEVK
jgi:hypothetical protein